MRPVSTGVVLEGPRGARPKEGTTGRRRNGQLPAGETAPYVQGPQHELRMASRREQPPRQEWQYEILWGEKVEHYYKREKRKGQTERREKRKKKRKNNHS